MGTVTQTFWRRFSTLVVASWIVLTLWHLIEWLEDLGFLDEEILKIMEIEF